MAEDKFAKTIDDTELDKVAGGTRAENINDVKFLRAMGNGINLTKRTRNFMIVRKGLL